jgi:hypothetical protein
MVKLYTAFTEELDDPQAAAAEILERLNPQENMRENTVGLIFFHYDFAQDGILEAFAEALPFPLIGCVSNYTGASGEFSDFAVSVTMFTGDDVQFKVKTVDGLDTKGRDCLKSEFNGWHDTLSENSESPPRLVMMFMPSRPEYSISDILHDVSEQTQIPFFGLTAFNIDGVPNTNYVLGNGVLSDSACVILEFYGNVRPQFHITNSYDPSESFGDEAVITDCDNTILKSVDNMPALEYLQKKGLISDSISAAAAEIAGIPVTLTYQENGAQVACALLGIVDGTQHILTARSLGAGSKIVLSHLDEQKTLDGIKSIVRELRDELKNDFIVFSSAARAWAFGANYFTELQEFADSAKKYEEERGNPFTYSIAYSGGEMCPVPKDGGNYGERGELWNMIHNFTLVVCSFTDMRD